MNKNRLAVDNYRASATETIEAMHFITPGLSYRGTEISADISVNVVTGKAKKSTERRMNVLSFVVRNGKDELIAPSGRTSVCMIGNRIYFKDDSRGFKLTGKKDSNHKYFRLNYENNNLPDEQCRAFIGDYELKYNKSLNLYYIEKK